MENFRIESLEINKIGAFEHLKMDFPKKTDLKKAEIHILTGENGTGKSTILMLLASIADKNNDDSIYKRSWNFRKPFNPTIEKVNYVVDFPLLHPFLINETNQIEITIPLRSPVKRLQEIDSNATFQYEIPSCAFFAYTSNRYIADIEINAMEEITTHPLVNALEFNKNIDPKTLIQWIANIKTKEFIARGKNDIVKADKYKESVQRIESTISSITSSNIIFDFEDDPLSVSIIIDNQKLSFDTLPDGLKSLISWIGDLLMRLDRMVWEKDLPIFDRNFILFLDEIEVHLHPAWQRKILPVVQKLFKNAQIFISTHSPFVVGSVDGAWVHKLKKVGAYAVLDGEPILSEDAESYDTILEEVFGIKERFGNEIEAKLDRFKKITKEILKGNEENLEEWNAIISFFQSQSRPEEIMAVISPQVHQINRIRKQVIA